MSKRTQSLTDDKKILPKKSKSNDVTLSDKIQNSKKTNFDKLDIQIIAEILKNPDIKALEISSKLKIPLSTIQRRRARIENSSMLKREYTVDYKQFGVRRADIQ